MACMGVLIMKQYGKRIYYEKITGNVIVSTPEKSGDVIEYEIEHEILLYKELSELNRETFDVIQLEFGQYAQDFAECNGYRVNPQTKQLEFSYPDPNEPESPPVYQKPLSQEIEELKEAQATTDTTLLELMEVILI